MKTDQKRQRINCNKCFYKTVGRKTYGFCKKLRVGINEVDCVRNNVECKYFVK